MKSSVLDSHAILVYLNAEPGDEIVLGLLEEAKRGERGLYCCWVNLAEVLYITGRRHGREKAYQILQMLEQIPVAFLSADQQISWRAAEVKRDHKVSLGDAFAAGTAISLGAEVVTGDPEFARLEGLVSVVWLGR